MTMRNAILGAVAAVSLSAVGGFAHAQSCAADLSSLQGQITTPALQAMLTTPISQMITAGGGLTQTLAQVQQNLSNINAAIAQLPPGDQASAVSLNEAVVVLNAVIAALNCRIAAGGS